MAISGERGHVNQDEPLVRLLFFWIVTLAAVALGARWGQEGFLKSLHRAVFMHSFEGVDWLDVGTHYGPLALCVCIDVYLLGSMPRSIRIFSLIVVVPLIILAYWFFTNDYNY